MVQTWAGLRALEGWFVHSTLVCATLSEQSSGKETLGEGLEQHQDTKLVTCKRLLPDTLSSAGNKTSSSFRSPLARRCRKLNYRDKSWCGIEGKWLLRLFDPAYLLCTPNPCVVPWLLFLLSTRRLSLQAHVFLIHWQFIIIIFQEPFRPKKLWLLKAHSLGNLFNSKLIWKL